MAPTKQNIRAGGGTVRLPPTRQLVGVIAFTNHDAANVGDVTVTDASGVVILDAQLGPSTSCRLSGPSLPPLARGDVTVTASPGVDGTLTTAPANPGQ